MKRYVLERDKPFLVICNHGGDHFRGQDLDDPFATVTAARDAHGLVVPHVMRQFGASVGHAIDEPSATIVSRVNKSAMIAPVLANIANSKTTGRGPNVWPPEEPLRTITGSAGFGLIAPHVATMRNAQKPFNGADEPMHTITAEGAGMTLVAPSLQRFNSGATGSAMDEPAPTVTANSFIKRPGGAARWVFWLPFSPAAVAGLASLESVAAMSRLRRSRPRPIPALLRRR